MKRGNESVEGVSQDLGSKRGRFFNGIDENYSGFDRNKVEEEGVLVNNGGIDSSQVGITREFRLFDGIGGSSSGLKRNGGEENGVLVDNGGINSSLVDITRVDKNSGDLERNEVGGGVSIDNRGIDSSQVDITLIDKNSGDLERNEVGGGVSVDNGGIGSSQVDQTRDFRLFDEIDKSSDYLKRNEGEGGVSVDNGGIDTSEMDRNWVFFGDLVPYNLDVPSPGGVKESNGWEDNINFDSYFRYEEEQKGLGFDINIPVPGIESGGVLKHTQGPVIINIESDDSDNEVQIIGYTSGDKGKGKEEESGVPFDRLRNLANYASLALGLGMMGMDNDVGESSLNGGERRYTREEKGKASVDDDSWLSLHTNFAIDDYVWPSPERNPNQPIRITEPTTENVEIQFPVHEPVRIAQLDEQVRRRRYELHQEAWRETAKRFVRGVNQESSSSQKIRAPALDQLGNSPGPFSEALIDVVRARITKKTPELVIEWKPSEENRGKGFIPSLLDLSLKALAENAEGIVSLEQVPDVLRRRLTDLLCDTGRMNADILNLLVKGCPDEIRIKNCSWLTEEHFQQIFGNFRTNDLRVLQLDLCGQCMLDIAFRDTFSRSSNSFSSLAIVSLRGVCRLSDNGLKELIKSAPALQSINLGQCALLTSEAVNFIADSLGSNLRELYIDGCPKMDVILILPAFEKFRCLEVLSVAGLLGVNDNFVSEIITMCGRSIKELDLADCLELTDLSLKTIGSGCPDLRSLNISNVDKLTDLGLEDLANGCRSIQKLKLCRNDFSDEAMAAFLESSGDSLVELSMNNMTEVALHTALSLAKCSRKLTSLDLSWCRRITNEALGLIVDSCSSLKLLKIFGCRQITKVFVNGHSNGLVRIIGLNMTPILDHLNLLEPGEVFLRYSPLPICT